MTDWTPNAYDESYYQRPEEIPPALTDTEIMVTVQLMLAEVRILAHHLEQLRDRIAAERA